MGLTLLLRRDANGNEIDFVWEGCVILNKLSVQGRRELKATFLGVAESILIGKSSLRKDYDRLRTKGLSHRDAKWALARKAAAICWAVLKHDIDYDHKLEEKKTSLEAKQV